MYTLFLVVVLVAAVLMCGIVLIQCRNRRFQLNLFGDLCITCICSNELAYPKKGTPYDRLRL